ncbi:CRISPR-associated helicase Cas3' [Actinomadura adrarensis]|uniref:CRISPR-associated helicase Cas3 n=1 Tax=Actinomadura adrarensis TaxID=1819600 RepID=A0ABW3CS31_9ACTN
MQADDHTREAWPAIDVRLWGKENGLPAAYPVICHLMDTAAIAGALWDVWKPSLGVLREISEKGVTAGQLRSLISFWAGLHDIGKISPSFQVLVEDLYRALVSESPAYGEEEPVRGLSHNEISQWVLVEILREFGYPGSTRARRDVSHQIAQLLGGHHGIFCPAIAKAVELADPRGSRDGIGTGVWEEQCRAHAIVLRELTGAEEPLVERLPVPAAVVVLGIVIVADWLASQEEFIAARIPPAAWVGSPEELQAHWQGAVAVAPQIVRDAGLGRAEFSDRSFQELFVDFEPNALQASVAAQLPGLVNGPGLLLVTAPPGDGKTEVALYGASVLARATGAGGLGFCLPTVATTDAMHDRVADFAQKVLTGDAALTRVHSMAWLSQDSAGASAAGAAEAERVVTDHTASLEATQWLHSSRRGLLAPLSTFTIDQGLSGVLPVKYNVLRLLALAGKVVVVDEAHSYDAWMHALLVRLLEWLGALKASVILLSATLTGTSARSLVEAYLRGGGHEPAGEIRSCYPGWLFADAVTGVVSPPREVVSERQRKLSVVRRPVLRGPDSETAGHRLSVIKDLLQPVIEEDRGCVLVCCTTVAEAQETHRELGDWFDRLQLEGKTPPGLRLLHSRFRAKDRTAIVDLCEGDFGKTGGRPRTVLVATQIVEQSLDLDFDLLITDLAPMALLLQRSGRCQRHRNKDRDRHQGRRPSWIAADPQIVVLDPVNCDGQFTVPKEWGDVYDASLLHRTSRLLQEQGHEPIAISADVQKLVDAVYADDFGSVVVLDDSTERKINSADGERLAKEAAHQQLAEFVKIDPPYSRKLHDLWRLSNTEVEVDESLIATRLGADSERLVCVYEQESGRWTLDEHGAVPVPGLTSGTRVNAEQARLIAQHMIPVPGRWLREGTELLELPSAWEKNSVLREWVLLPMRKDSTGNWYGRVRSGTARYGQSTGLKLLN